jgi:hypothetical protein
MSSLSVGRLALRLSTIRRAFADVPDVPVGIITDLLITQDNNLISLNQSPGDVLALTQDVQDFAFVTLQNGDILIDQDDNILITQQYVSS